jgi:hypothetical protein
MTHEQSKVPDLWVEQLHLGELSERDERRLRAQLSAEEIEARLQSLRAQDQRFREGHDHEGMLHRIRGEVRSAKARASEARARRQRIVGFGASFVAAAAALLLFLRPGTETSGVVAPGPEDIRIKGLSAHLVLHRRVGDEAEVLADGARARPGDVIQVGYVAADAKFGVIVSIDGAGAVTLHFPEHERASTKLSEGGEQRLGHAYELDDAPDFERFFFVASKRPIAASEVMRAARRLAEEPAKARRLALGFDGQVSESAFMLEKE